MADFGFVVVSAFVRRRNIPYLPLTLVIQPFIYITLHRSSISLFRQGKDITTVGSTLINLTMFSSFSSFSNPFSVPRFLGGNPGTAIDIKSVEVHDVETRHEKRARTLKHLLKLNHANHSIVYHNLQFHNHMPHVPASLLM